MTYYPHWRGPLVKALEYVARATSAFDGAAKRAVLRVMMGSTELSARVSILQYWARGETLRHAEYHVEIHVPGAGEPVVMARPGESLCGSTDGVVTPTGGIVNCPLCWLVRRGLRPLRK